MMPSSTPSLADFVGIGAEAAAGIGVLFDWVISGVVFGWGVMVSDHAGFTKKELEETKATRASLVKRIFFTPHTQMLREQILQKS
jgi:hypothetical protein